MSSLPPLGAPSPASRREHVIQTLRAAITSARLAPGQKLNELEVAAQLGTSRAPVREAFRQLEQEGLVITFPYRGTEVLGVSQEEIEHVLVPVRIALERFAFRSARQHLTDDAVVDLEACIDDMRRAAASGGLEHLADADIAFHRAVVELSGQQHCRQLWHTIQPRVRAYFLRDAKLHEDAGTVVRQHEELLEVLRSGDEDGVDEAIRAHIEEHFTSATG